MSTLLSVGGTAGFAATPTSASVTGGNVYVRDTLGWVFGDIEVITDLGDAYQPVAPGDGTTEKPPTQQVELRIAVPSMGVDWGSNDIISISVERSLREGSAWSFGIPATKAWGTPNALGHEVNWWAPPPGVHEVDVEGAYFLPNGDRHALQLITDGISNDSKRALKADGHLTTLTGLGPMGRWDRVLVSLQLAPNHGLTHGDLVDALADLAGIPPSQRAVAGMGSPRMKPVEICLEEWWGISQEIAESFNHAIFWDRDGALQMEPYFDDSKSASFTLTEADVTAATGVALSTIAEIPTCVRVNGQRQADPKPEGIVTTTVIDEVYEPFDVPQAEYRQTAGTVGVGGAGNITALNPTYPLTPPLILVKRTTTHTTKDGDCLIKEEVIEEGFKESTEHARYARDGGATNDIGAYYQVYFYDAATPSVDGNENGYASVSWYFTELSRQITTYGPYADQIQEGGLSWYGKACGRLYYVDTRTAAWWVPTAANQERRVAPDDTEFWFIAGDYYGDGRKTADGTHGGKEEIYIDAMGYDSFDLFFSGISPSWRPQLSWNRLQSGAGSPFEGTLGQSVTATTFLEGDCPFKIQDEMQETLIERERGQDFIWSDGFSGGENWERLTRVELRTYQLATESSHVEVVSSDHYLDGITSKTRHLRDGYLPNGTVCLCDERGNTQQVWAKVCGLEDNHTGYESIVDNDWIESEEEATDLAVRLLLEGAAIPVTLELAANLAVETGNKITIQLPRWGLTKDGFVERVTWERGATADPILTKVELLLIPDVDITVTTGVEEA